MRGAHRPWRRYLGRIAGGLAAPAVLSLVPSGFAEPPTAPERIAAPAAPQPAAIVCALAGYRRLAMERQPSLAAYRASVAAAEGKVHALDSLHVPTIIRRDLPTRRLQAEQGVVAAQAQLSQAEWNTLYAVTRTYLSAAYAQTQLRVADQALSEKDVLALPYLREVAEEIRKTRTRRDVREWNVKQIDVLIQVTRGRREEALEGVQRALAGLREAIGVEEGCFVPPADLRLPLLDIPVDREQIIALALARRGEVVLAGVGAEVTALEVKAQGATLLPSAKTFASGADLHANPIPQGATNSEYRPGAVGIEMPPTLNGCRSARIEQARDLSGRAVAVADKARNLVILDAEDAYLHWLQASRQVAEYEKAVKTSEDVAKEVSGLFQRVIPPEDRDKPNSPTLEDLLSTRVRATQLRLQLNQARFELLLALANLERVTAGGFCPGFDLPLPADPGTGNGAPR
jgi:outer membrane protein TolC